MYNSGKKPQQRRLKEEPMTPPCRSSPKSLPLANMEAVIIRIQKLLTDFEEQATNSSKAFCKCALTLIGLKKGTFNPFEEETLSVGTGNLKLMDDAMALETGRILEAHFDGLLKGERKLQSIVASLDPDLTRLATTCDLIEREHNRMPCESQRLVYWCNLQVLTSELRTVHKRMLLLLKERKHCLEQLPILCANSKFNQVRQMSQYWRNSTLTLNSSHVRTMLTHCSQLCSLF
ncbi:hypothetical protein Ciccas_001114 [Cichlidogyrus casuarinus]|uniref:Uncharacterized protein n=1 Tax=Cichlidogyrus casuarinus TaxID=1844966 RepID=A0ABD2QKX9_9PLAT